MEKINSLETWERPREKLHLGGVKRLSDTELLAVLLGSGTTKAPICTLATKVLEEIDRYGEHLKIEQLLSIQGIGFAKAAMIVAALEFGRRRIRPEGIRIRAPQDVFPLLRHLADKRQERFIGVTLNGAHEVIETRVLTLGLVNSTKIHPREVFADAISDRATAILVAHNHPSGDLNPSPEDIAVTERLVQCGKIIGIPILDHLIFSERGFTSLKELGYLGT